MTGDASGASAGLAGGQPPDLSSAQERAAVVARFLLAPARERRTLLQALRPYLERDDVIRMAPVLRESSPKIAARLTSLLARFDLEREFRARLVGLKPGKIRVLEAHFRKIRRPDR